MARPCPFMEAGLPAHLLTRPDRTRPKVGVIHLGPGGFFRAHAAIYLAEAMAASGGDWGVRGASLQRPDMRDALRPQGYAYVALEAGPAGDRAQVIDVIEDILVAPENPAALIAAMADPAVRIVSLTVTEKGYCHHPARASQGAGALNLRHPDIVHDLASDLPRSAIGFLVRALAVRRAAGDRPFTMLSCDNLPQNGAVLRGVVLDFARALDAGLADWIAAEARFPASMVDRIVPAPRPEDRARVAALGLSDAAPVIHEPFRQWVIEDDFVDAARPDFVAVGVRMVADVAPYEAMKLRMLNGTHSALAYLGYLAGFETIAETVADAGFADFVRHLWVREIIPALTPPEGSDLHDYAAALLVRYQNPAIRHRCWQIAMDGSQKLPQRILATLEAARAPCPGLCLAVAAWMVYVSGVDESGGLIEVKDPLAPELLLAATSADPVAALLALRAVFTPDQAQALEPPIRAAYARLRRLGAHRAVTEVLQEQRRQAAPASEAEK